MTRSPIPALCLQVLASDPTRDRPYTTTEVRDGVARLGRSVTRDTIANHLRRLDVLNPPAPPIKWRGKSSLTGEHLWALTGAGWGQHNQLPRADFAYCEPVTGTGLDTWHIRRLTDAGRMLHGGIDTPTLCGRTWQGWDLEADVTIDSATTGARTINHGGMRDVCKACAEALPAAVTT
jgi:hypothetical protein